MSRRLKADVDLSSLFLRIGFAGIMLLSHGYPKLQTLLSLDSAQEVPFVDPIGIGKIPSLVLVVFSEFLCSVFIILGFRVRLASFFLIVTMLVALFFHWDDPFSKKELALVYLLGFTTLAFLGGGRYSVFKF